MTSTGSVHRLRFRAHAKINLALRVGAAGDDGFHPLATVFQTVSLADLLYACLAPPADAPGGLLRLSVHGADLPEGNTVTAAVAALAAALRARGHDDLAPVDMQLVKRVPVGAGLGGGSSDAAAAMRACLRLWNANLGAAGPGAVWGTQAAAEAQTDWLIDVAAGVGTDVPFFLYGGTALGTGRGTDIEPLPDLHPVWLVVTAPRCEVPTAAAYGAFDDLVALIGAPAFPERPPYSPELDVAWMGNDLTPAVADLWPEVERARQALEAHGARIAQMTGSGAASFGTFTDRRAASEAATGLRDAGFWARACLTIDRLKHLRRV